MLWVCSRHVTAYAKLAFIGGSFAEKGGHNALEGALFGIPMLMGPSIYNNPEICQHLSNTGALEILQTDDELLPKVITLLDDAKASKQLGTNGQQVLEFNGGAVDATLSLIEQYL